MLHAGLKRPFGSGSMAAFGSSAAMNGAGSASPATPAPVFGNQETIAGGTLTPNSGMLSGPSGFKDVAG